LISPNTFFRSMRLTRPGERYCAGSFAALYPSGDDREDYQSHSQSHSRNGSQGVQDRVCFDGV